MLLTLQLPNSFPFTMDFDYVPSEGDTVKIGADKYIVGYREFCAESMEKEAKLIIGLRKFEHE